jgi:hypothetical protein
VGIIRAALARILVADRADVGMMGPLMSLVADNAAELGCVLAVIYATRI